MSSSDSSSSTSGDDSVDRDPGPGSSQSTQAHLSSVALTEPAAETTTPAAAETQEARNGVGYDSASGSDLPEIEGSDEEEPLIAVEGEIRSDSGAAEAGEGLGREGIVWGRTNSELEVEDPSSPSSSGYAGERGSSGASSGGGSGIDEVGGDEIQELRNVAVIDDGVSDSGATWLPGKRHLDEVFQFRNNSSYIILVRGLG